MRKIYFVKVEWIDSVTGKKKVAFIGKNFEKDDKKIMDKLIEDLIKETYKLIDYSLCMQMATGYKGENKPNYLYITRLVEDIKKTGKGAGYI